MSEKKRVGHCETIGELLVLPVGIGARAFQAGAIGEKELDAINRSCIGMAAELGLPTPAPEDPDAREN